MYRRYLLVVEYKIELVPSLHTTPILLLVAAADGRFDYPTPCYRTRRPPKRTPTTVPLPYPFPSTNHLLQIPPMPAPSRGYCRAHSTGGEVAVEVGMSVEVGLNDRKGRVHRRKRLDRRRAPYPRTASISGCLQVLCSAGGVWCSRVLLVAVGISN